MYSMLLCWQWNWGSTESDFMVSVCFHGRQKQLVSLVKLPTVLSAPVCFIYSQWSAHTKVSSGSTASPRFVSWFHKKNKPCSRIPPPPFLFFEASLDNFDTLQLQRESFPKVMIIYLQRMLDIKVPHISVHHTDYKKTHFWMQIAAKKRHLH